MWGPRPARVATGCCSTCSAGGRHPGTLWVWTLAVLRAVECLRKFLPWPSSRREQRQWRHHGIHILMGLAAPDAVTNQHHCQQRHRSLITNLKTPQYAGCRSASNLRRWQQAAGFSCNTAAPPAAAVCLRRRAVARVCWWDQRCAVLRQRQRRPWQQLESHAGCKQHGRPQRRQSRWPR